MGIDLEYYCIFSYSFFSIGQFFEKVEDLLCLEYYWTELISINQISYLFDILSSPID